MTRDGLPDYWLNKGFSADQRAAIEAYLHGTPMSTEQVAQVREYCQQWIDAPGWRGEDIDRLRSTVRTIGSRDALRRWLDRADEAGLDPL